MFVVVFKVSIMVKIVVDVTGGTNTTNLCAIYNIETNKWIMNGVMPFGRNHAAMTYNNERNEFVIIGGRIGKNVPSDCFTQVQIYSLNNKNIKPLPVACGGTGCNANNGCINVSCYQIFNVFFHSTS